ncbi:MAG: HEAT repeat domain-containing protein [Janibacter sp.]|nr:HEAT repeat domain-containing protein [Janibacter sp.]
MSTSLERALQAARHDDSSVRQRAALWLGTYGDESIADELVSLLVTEPDFYVRETLTWAVVTRAASTYPRLIDHLSDGGPERVQVLHALSKIREPASVAEILPLADDEDDAVAAKAWWALGRIGTPGAAAAIVDHLGDEDEFRRRELTRALEQAGEAAVAGLASRLSDPEPSVRRHAAEALLGIGDPAARPAAAELFRVVEDDDKEVVLPAIEALAELDLPEVDDVLVRLRDGDDAWLSITAGWLLTDRAERH